MSTFTCDDDLNGIRWINVDHLMVLNKAHVEHEAQPNQRKLGPGQSNQFLVVFKNGNVQKHPNTHGYMFSHVAFISFQHDIT